MAPYTVIQRKAVAYLILFKQTFFVFVLLLEIALYKMDAVMQTEMEEKVYTRPLPLTSCQEDPPWVWTIRSCAMADLVYQFHGRTVLEGKFRENLLGLPLWRYDHPGVWSVVGRRN